MANRRRSATSRAPGASVEVAPEQRAPKRKTEIALGENAIEDQPLWAQMARVGGAVSPLDVSSVLREADMGRTHRLVDLVHEFRQKDGHLQSILQRREQAVAKLTVQCRAPDGAKKRDKKSAEVLERALRKAKGFRQAVAHLVGESTLFGHSTVQVIWGRQDGLLVPVEFKCVGARRFGFRMSDGKLLFDPTVTGFGDVNAAGVDLLAEYTPGKFIQIRRRVNGDVEVREGLARVICWLACFRTWDISDWLKFAELSWKPLRRGGYMKGASKEDIAALDNALRYFTAAGWVRYNKETTSFEVDWPKNGVTSGNGSHKELAEFLASEMSKAVLCGTLTTEAGSKGARSLGEVHQEGLEDVTEGDEQTVSEAFTIQLAGPFAQMNYGERAMAAVIEFPMGDEVNLKEFGAGIGALVNAGLPVPVSWVLEKTGIPQVNGDEEVLKPVASGEPKPDGDKPNGDGDDSGKDGEQKPKAA